ncbi:MAG: transcriptional repressor [Candidatus Krumholzibacteria bacterium]|nr:transcriptional repressor [Candidatus Krumholzibacteria bacterium]
MRKTRQREVIREELTKLDSHPSADELYRLVRKRLPRISLGTVYRNLDVMFREGMIQRLDVGGSQMRFDGDRSDHQHIRCVRCGRIDDMEALPELTKSERDAVKGAGYRLLARRIEFLGLCPACVKKAGRH